MLDTQAHVKAQYEKWMYPEPVMDLSQEPPGVRNASDPQQMCWAYWPTAPAYQPELDILVAGCGTNSAARYAYTHPQARVVGIDLSTSSLEHQRYLKQKHQLDNLTLHHLPIQEVASLGKDFDLIDCCGVLHHIPEPVEALSALRSVLRPEGSIFLMLYGKYGRTGVYMLQDLFRTIGLKQDDESLAIIRETLQGVSPDHYVNVYMQGEGESLDFGAGLVDTFIHAYDKGYSVTDCLDLLKDSGFTFQGWKENYFYYPDGQMAKMPQLRERLNDLSDEQLWQAMELIHGRLFQHRFYACRSDRPKETYHLDLASEAFWNYVPVNRMGDAFDVGADTPEGLVIQRNYSPRMTLGKSYAALLRQVDGTKTVRDCINSADMAMSEAKRQVKGREFLTQLWRMGYLHFRNPSQA